MATIENRLKPLERVAAPKGDQLYVFLNLGGDAMRGYRSGDVEVKRLPGESVEALTERIALIDVDIARETDGEKQLSLRERRLELATQREQAAAEMARIEHDAAILSEKISKLGMLAAKEQPDLARDLMAVALSVQTVGEIGEQIKLHEQRIMALERRAKPPRQTYIWRGLAVTTALFGLGVLVATNNRTVIMDHPVVAGMMVVLNFGLVVLLWRQGEKV